MPCSKIAKTVFAKLLPALFLMSASLCGAQAREVTDALGNKVELPEQPKRVVTLMPSLAEVAADVLGDQLDRIVGVSEYTDYPPALKKTVSVGPYHQINLEKILSLKPDLVLASLDGNIKDQVLHLKEMGIQVVLVRTTTLSEVEQSMTLIATALGNPDAGTRMVTQLKKGLQHLETRARSRAMKKKVLLELGDGPLIVIGGRSFLSEGLAIIGARNVYAEAEAHYPRPSLEDVIRKDPDEIIVLAMGRDLDPYQRMAANWSTFPRLKAVKEKRIHVIQAESAIRPSLRLLEGLSLLEKTIYGSPN